MKQRPLLLPTWLGTLVVFLASILLVGIAQAAPPFVKTVPCVASNPLIPHDIFNGEQTRLKGATDMQGAGIEYTWDFGDGTPVVTGTVTNMNVIEAMHTYTGSVGDVYVARLTVTNTGTGESASRPYFLQIRDKTLETEVNVAIDEGLWFLHKDRGFRTCGSLPCSFRTHSYGTAGYLAATASAVNAFEANGHLESGDVSNPYTGTVQSMLRYVFFYLMTEPISLQSAGDPDSNGNGLGIRAATSYFPYVGGTVMDAIITSGTPDTLAPTGPTGVIGRRYADIVQDMIDSYAYGQYDSGPNRGGWRYVWNQGPDNSAAQWGAIGMMPAEENWGLTVPPWVKTENLVWLNYSQYYTGFESSRFYGGFGYASLGQTPAGTASGMVQLAFDDELTTTVGGRWQAAEKWVRFNWNAFVVAPDYYAMFALTKAMRQAVPNPVVTICDGNPACGSLTPLDWYDDNLIGFARTLVNRQSAGGNWVGGNRSYLNPGMTTPWSVLILSKSLFEAGSPVAVADAIPNPAVAGQTITLDGSASFHQDVTKSIVGWEWDLDNDGTFDATGPTATTSFAALGDFPVVLRVTDDGDPAKTDDTIVTVRVTTPPIAPTADANGPYVFCPQAIPWFLDGTGSVNPDEGVSEVGQPGDTIIEYAWDLDGDTAFDDAFGPQPDITAYFTALGIGDYLIQLKVTDNTSVSFPSSGMGDLSDNDSAQVSVKDAVDEACGCIDDLYARPKSGQVQLVWTHSGADHYNVYRSTTMGGPYTFIGSTTSTYSTYLDTGLTNGVTYFYIVRPAAINGNELCQSDEVNATPIARRRR